MALDDWLERPISGAKPITTYDAQANFNSPIFEIIDARRGDVLPSL
jgi:hypothetical protein